MEVVISMAWQSSGSKCCYHAKVFGTGSQDGVIPSTGINLKSSAAGLSPAKIVYHFCTADAAIQAPLPSGEGDGTLIGLSLWATQDSSLWHGYLSAVT